MIGRLHLVALYGTGDAYLVCALAREVERHHGRPVTVVVKASHAVIPEMFGLTYAIDNILVSRAEGDGIMHRSYENDIARVLHYFVHPHFLRSGVRVDRLTVKPEVSQADMYRALLHLPPDAPLALPRVPQVARQEDTVLLIPEARSWPNTQPDFWAKLADRLTAAGRTVFWNAPTWTLTALLERCAASEWVIGPQCGVMAILAHARFPCRKTFATPSIDGGRYPGLPVASTFPYAYVTKFAGEDYDVEEFQIFDHRQDRLIEWIATGVNARRLWPVRTEPVHSVMAPLSPGDFFDRLAVLSVKHERLPPDLAAGLRREYTRYLHLAQQLPHPHACFELDDLHREGFDLHERFVRGALAGKEGLETEHAACVRLNKRRVELRQAIDEAWGAATTEVKSYYTTAAAE